MTNNKTQLSEGILTSLVDNFFKSLERGVSDRYIKAAEKADLHPEVIASMKRIQSENDKLHSIIKKYHL
jgi:hypothetical protein